MSAPAVTTDAELAAMLPDPTTLTLESGTGVQLNRLRSMETFAFLKIITKGLGEQAGMLSQLSSDDEEGEFVKKLLMMVFAALPNAFPEAAAFIRMMVRPVALSGGRNKA